MKPVLFLSHSSKDNALVERIKALIEKDDACKTVLDVHDLQQAREWRTQLYQWMACCQAGLVLLTKDGVSSDWVLQEATILRARKALEPGFKVFLVAPQEVKTELPERWRLFAPLQLDEIQGMQTLDPEVIAGHVGKAVAEMVQAQRRTFFDQLAGLIGDNLDEIKTKDHTRRLLSDKLGLEDAEWHRITGGPGTVIELIARRLCIGDLGQCDDLESFLKLLQQAISKDNLRRLLNVLAAYWVSLPASALIAMADSADAPRVLAMRVRKPNYLPYRYIERQYLPYGDTPRIVMLCEGNETLTELRTQLLRQLPLALGYEPGDLTEDGVFDELEQLEKERAKMVKSSSRPKPRIIVLLPGIRSEKLVVDLADEFSSLLFLAMVQDSSELRAQWTSCRWIDPELPERDELRFNAQFNCAARLTS